ncbi:MAG: DUF4105 domain-containing protein, partial [Xanthomonadaceae bacterium]|nr:DUF4105 domain-containing protein [Xanthomonadaceae bacterium]
RFGHIAILLRDRASGEARTFNYGIFDFAQKDFYLNFARGRMIYRMDSDPADDDIASYMAQGRSVREEILAFTPAQAAALRDFLYWNLEPQHARYRYDYFTANCSTQVRDALDRALGGVILAQTQAPSSGFTYRMQTDRLLAPDPALMLLVDLGLGPYADRRLSYWDESFVPMVLARVLREVQVPVAGGGLRPLVVSDRLLAPNRITAPPALPPDLRLPLLATGLLWAALIAAPLRWPQRRALRRVSAVAGGLYALLGGLAGLLMLALWTLTAHRAAWGNENLWLFDPALLLLIVPLLRQAGTAARSSVFARGLSLLLALAAAFALFSKILPGFPQQNLPWILLGLPLDLALAGVLWRRR